MAQAGEATEATAVLPSTVHDTSAPVDDAANTRGVLPVGKCEGGRAAVPVAALPGPRIANTSGPALSMAKYAVNPPPALCTTHSRRGRGSHASPIPSRLLSC